MTFLLIIPCVVIGFLALVKFIDCLSNAINHEEDGE